MKIKPGEICLYSMLGTLIFALKFIMSGLPNIEPVSLLLIIYTIIFRYKTFYILIVYILFEILMYGFSFWSIGYFYIWPILIFAILIINKNTNKITLSIISGLFGLLFGAFYIPLYFIAGGPSFAITWWISGIPYDAIHGISNFILCLILFKPLYNILFKLNKMYNIGGYTL